MPAPKGGNRGSFKPGVSGNPKGGPKKDWSLTQSMRDYLSETDPETKKLRKDLFIESQMKHALKGDPTAAKHLWQYLDGMPKGTNPFGSESGSLTITWGADESSDSDSAS